VPSIPGFPSPGRNIPFPSVSELVTLTSFGVSTQSGWLALHGFATAINPAPFDLNLSVPSLPFDVSLIDNDSGSPVHVASVTTLPFKLTYPNVTLSIHGVVPPISTSAVPTLSRFISRYLSAEDNQVLISSPIFFPSLSTEVTFPAPNPRPRVLRNVTIKDMRIKPGGNAFLASGTVQALIVLPRGFDVSLDVLYILPEVIVFDGEVPFVAYEHNVRDGRRRQPPDELPPDIPLPDPIPEGAFGHIKPWDWLISRCVRVNLHSQNDGAAYAVSAKVEDVPLEVLPGRQREFSNFVKKVLCVLSVLNLNVHYWRRSYLEREVQQRVYWAMPLRLSMSRVYHSRLPTTWAKLFLNGFLFGEVCTFRGMDYWDLTLDKTMTNPIRRKKAR